MVEIIMPKAGVDMQEGTIVSWFKKEGDTVSTGEPILEIVTDKVNMEVEAEGDGILAVITHKTEGEVLPVFTVIGAIAEKGENPAEIKSQILSLNNQKDVEVEPTNLIKNESNDKQELKTSSEYDYDIIVVGGGPGGYVSAISSAMLGAKVAIVEVDKFGGTCLNRGCIPTKAYMQNVELLESLKEFAKRGLCVKVEEQDIKKSVKYKNRITKKLVAGVEGLLKSRGVTLYKTKATIKNRNEVILESGEVLTTKNIIIATGSKPATSDIKGSESSLILDSTQALDIDSKIESISILGADFIGCEFAEIFNSRGAKVTLIESDEEILSDLDSEVVKTLKEALSKKGIQILTNKRACEFIENEDKLVIKFTDGEEIISQKVLLSLGREANLSGVEDCNIKIEDGFVSVNDKMETSIEGIYAVGDVTGLSMTAHAAFAMGEIAAKNIMGQSIKFQSNMSPKCLYTVPQVASVGLTEMEAKKLYDVKVGKFNFASNGKALAESLTDGFVKVITESKYDEILGIHIIGSKANEIINEGVILKTLEIPADEASSIIFAHPTMSEVLKEALADVNNSSIHTPKR